METQKILQADYLDIVFDNRNKSYGGYDLRKKYPDRAKRATIAVLLCVSIICAVPVIASSLNRDHNTTAQRTIEINIPTALDNIPKQPRPAQRPEPVTKAPAIKQPAAVAATAAFTPPRIVDNNLAINETPPIDDLADKLAGTRNTDGDQDGKVADTGQPHGKGDGGTEIIQGDPEPPVADFAEVMPEFDGDIYSYLQKNIRYPESAREAGVEGRVFLQFVVNENGHISNVEVVKSAGKSLDAEALRVVSGMPKWKPGKTKGKDIKVYFKLPITFQLG